jgi:hypothetical protein
MTEPDEHVGKDPRTWRLMDLSSEHQVDVRCQCGRTATYMRGLLQRKYRLPSDMLIYDLQYRLRCNHCNSRSGFTITIFDRTGIGMRPYEEHENITILDGKNG